jgi:tetratricopeptide (TPR) repeat protein
MKNELIQRAVVLAQKAVDLEPKKSGKGMYLNTLGVAQYRAGNWPEAIDALKKSDQLLKGDSYSFNGFFLSMAHWQLGHKYEAHQHYQKSVVWMQKNMPDDEQQIEELIRFRAEAERLLGLPAVAPKPKPDQKEN